ncbi:hypothetical protein [Epinotia aporema granulovirus]|uniref:Uncharacterized protein n=1 Tax=Epinotia aporema granulovirus TaxID=166056 RepID=K4EQT2_9BBAC|nr:hypothetical protein [Epinotia aporema granulovirus]AER41481.1 hypothetical protein [Epinotia aporema granulovirus]
MSILCVRCKSNSVLPSFNRINYCDDCGTKCMCCSNNGRLRRLDVTPVVPASIKLLQPEIVHKRYRLFSGFYFVNTFDTLSFVLLCDGCKYNFCWFCKKFAAESKMYKVTAGSTFDSLQNGFICRECVNHCGCNFCEIDDNSLKQFVGSTSEIFFWIV